MAGYLNRENRVPYYQRLFQEGHKQHIRQWNQTRMGRNMLRVYYTTFIITGAGTFLHPNILTLRTPNFFAPHPIQHNLNPNLNFPIPESYPDPMLTVR
ncbi:hypothetical protein HYFRA_00014148 [Hymenoscyphus fraxineus]|uniref:Uncharacterized protein n=1 Tax=Hymenoscyphus fraxineus TaxID=746836 RepID=A0A9N9LF92_9HELO|nr:hypothetical protein HYFRA_00014148 [Hymenoscyphus fraxineus]